MSKYIPGNQKHLTLNDRIYIENELAKGTSFKDMTAIILSEAFVPSDTLHSHATLSQKYPAKI